MLKKPLGLREFAKYQALGNDYLVADAQTVGIEFTPKVIQSICHRHYGMGSDGILALVPSQTADFGLRIYNPDGSEAEKSGNGLRIFACFLYDCGYTKAQRFSVETPGGQVQCDLQIDAATDRVTRITVDMGRANFTSNKIPVTGAPREVVGETLTVLGESFPVTCVTVGNPHCVRFVEALHVEDLRRLGSAIEHHPSFPKRINVQFAHVVSRNSIDVLIWERGAGETMASGSSSCAVAAAAYKSGLVDGQIEMRMPGGVLHIEIDAQFNLRMSGPAQGVYRGVVISSEFP